MNDARKLLERITLKILLLLYTKRKKRSLFRALCDGQRKLHAVAQPARKSEGGYDTVRPIAKRLNKK
jgi:predicted methyltransferase